MGDMCGDSRFEIIAEAKKKIIESTNIESSPDEMKVLDSFLFRAWQMRWLPESKDKKSFEELCEDFDEFCQQRNCPEGPCHECALNYAYSYLIKKEKK